MVDMLLMFVIVPLIRVRYVVYATLFMLNPLRVTGILCLTPSNESTFSFSGGRALKPWNIIKWP